jgi:hypothetical protein
VGNWSRNLLLGALGDDGLAAALVPDAPPRARRCSRCQWSASTPEGAERCFRSSLPWLQPPRRSSPALWLEQTSTANAQPPSRHGFNRLADSA